MRILQITSYSIPDNKNHVANGIASFVTQLGEYFIRNHQDTLFLGYYDTIYGSETASIYSDKIVLSIPFDANEFLAFIKKNQIDVIQCNLSRPKQFTQIPFIAQVAHQEGIKMVFCLHTIPGGVATPYGSFEESWYYFAHHKPFLNRYKRWIIYKGQPLTGRYCLRSVRKDYNIIYQSCDNIVLFSEPYIDKYCQIAHLRNRKKFSIIHNPLTYSEFLSKEKVHNKRKEVLMVGRMQESQKRVSKALKIWKMIEQNPMLEDWSIRFIGDGDEFEFHQWLAKHYKLKRVLFNGQGDPMPYYQQDAILISTSCVEGWPMSLMEAMPMGCCCFSFDSYDAVHDIIEDGYNGKIIPNDDLEAYVNCLTELMLDDSKRVVMGVNAIESSYRFIMDKIGEKWHELFVKMMEE